MGWPKGVPRTEEFKLGNRINTLLLRALGCCKKPADRKYKCSEETKALLSKILSEQRNTPEWKERSRLQGQKCKNISNWRASLSPEKQVDHSARVGVHN